MGAEPRRQYTEPFKLHVVGEVESGKISQSDAMRKYGILGHSTILKWRRKYGNGGTNCRIIPRGHKMEKQDREVLHLENEIKALKQELEDARIKNVVLETLVDVAERELSVPIRKKYGAKRSGK